MGRELKTRCRAKCRRVHLHGVPVATCVNGDCDVISGAGASLCEVSPISTNDGDFGVPASEGEYRRTLWHSVHIDAV